MHTNKMQAKKLNLWHYLKNYKLGISLYILVYLIAGACGIGLTIISAKIIELVTMGEYFSAIIYSLVNIGIVLVERGCWYISGVVYSKYSVSIISDLNSDLARQAFKLNSKTYSDHETGTFVQRIVSDPQRIVENCADMVDIITDVLTAVIMVIYITTLNGWISLILTFTFIIGIVIEFFRIKARRKNSKEVRTQNDKINSLTTEIVRSEKDIKSLGLEDRLSEVSKNNYKAYSKAQFKRDFTDNNFFAFRNILIDVLGIVSLILGIMLMDKGLLTLAAYVVINSNSGSVRRIVWCVGYISNCVTEIKISHERMFALFDEKEFVTEHFGTTKLEQVKGNIEFKDVSYTFKEYDYEEQGKKDKRTRFERRKLVSENKIFDKLSFTIEPNTTVAFVGKSGSGKSTILNLMSKMYEVDSGEVLIDNVNINSLDKESLRKCISLVNQFPYIFDMTIKENLLLAKPNATDDEIHLAIDKASLKEFVNGLPKGIDTKVGESGIKLSGGQKQRLAIARALLRNSSIIIFDESTSSLDNFAQEQIKQSIDELKGKSTIVIVAHRLSTIKNVDKIFFLDNGQIVDSGTFDSLYETNDKFKTMFLAENIE